MKYRSVELEKIKVDNLVDEIHMRLMAYVKACGAHGNTLAALEVEAFLDMQFEGKPLAYPIAAAVLSQAISFLLGGGVGKGKW